MKHAATPHRDAGTRGFVRGVARASETDAGPAAKIMLVDDHPVVRSGLRRLIAGYADIEIGCEAATASEALALLRTSRIAGVLLDLSLPDRSGLDVLRHIRAAQTDLPVLILTMHSERQFGSMAFKAGANGFISKSCPQEEVIDALRSVLRGQRYVSEGLQREWAVDDVRSDAEKAPHMRLSNREFQVFMKLAAGIAPGAIATRLCRSVRTIASHRANILAKMNMTSNAQLSYYAITHALLD